MSAPASQAYVVQVFSVCEDLTGGKESTDKESGKPCIPESQLQVLLIKITVFVTHE